MKRRLYILLAVIALLLPAGTVLAQGPVRPQHSDPFWRAQYWNNMTLSGQPAVQRSETSINYEWGRGSPAPGVNADHFSARWSRYSFFAPGTYRFSATSDDGVRIFVDNRLVLDGWSDHARQTFTNNVSISGGHHWVVIEYYENMVDALIHVSWVPASTAAPIHNWRGEYYDNPSLSGAPRLVRDDAGIDFNWGRGAAAAGMPADRFSVRWTRTVQFPAGTYRFTTTTDDGVRLWVNNHLLIDAWHDQSFTSHSGDIWLSGAVPIKMEYYENAVDAAARLRWVPVGGGAPPPAPSPNAVIVDDGSRGFVTGGAPRNWRTVREGYNGRLLVTRNNANTRWGYNWARWYPSLQRGRYEVYVYIPSRNATTTNARYWVAHAGGLTLRPVNQASYSNQWVSLGTYSFSGGRGDYVSLADVTYERSRSRLVAFDAVKWEPR